MHLHRYVDVLIWYKDNSQLLSIQFVIRLVFDTSRLDDFLQKNSRTTIGPIPFFQLIDAHLTEKILVVRITKFV